MHWFLICFSFLIVSLGQPDWSPLCCFLTATVGFALFWKGLGSFKSKKARFLCAALWFGAIQALQIGWLLSNHHAGFFVYLLLLLLVIILGAQFGCISLFVQPRSMGLARSFGIAGLWTLFEWSRLFIFSGYTLNPIGLTLSATLYGRQLVAVFGVFGLSFMVIFVNLIALQLITKEKKTRRNTLGKFRLGTLWVTVAALPFIYGAFHLHYHKKKMAEDTAPPLRVVLVQTALHPEERTPFKKDSPQTLSPYDQWARVLSFLGESIDDRADVQLIVLPEAVVPYGTHTPVYPPESVHAAFKTILGAEDFSFLPHSNYTKEGNGYWAQAIANFYDADVACGLEDCERAQSDNSLQTQATTYRLEEDERGGQGAIFATTPKCEHLGEERKLADCSSQPSCSGDGSSLGFQVYNAGFLFSPVHRAQRYEKRILVPGGEYMPFSWCHKLLSRYGLGGMYTPGDEAKVFESQTVPLGMTICYEETYGHLMRENKLKGAGLLVNMTNDAWFPLSRLPMVHFLHGRLRTVECGIPMVRACNNGVTCGIDSLGRMVDCLDYESSKARGSPGSLSLLLPSYSYSTLYTRYGDKLILSLSFVGLLGFLPWFHRR